MGDNVGLLDIRLQLSAQKGNQRFPFFLWTGGNHLAFPSEPLLACTDQEGGGAGVNRGGAARSP